MADAEVDESEGATLAFQVTLSRARDGETTVDYATSNATATAGADYNAESGTLTFSAGETSKTVSVTVLDDAHDEGSETLTLTLSNPSPSAVKIDDGEAMGTIRNTDAMPRAWMVRFGRTVGSQVVDGLNTRLEGAGGSHVTVAGINLVGAKGEEPTLTDDDPFGLPAWAKNAGREAEAQELTADDLLLRSAFHLTSGGDGTRGGPAFTAWGRGRNRRIRDRGGRSHDGRQGDHRARRVRRRVGARARRGNAVAKQRRRVVSARPGARE